MIRIVNCIATAHDPLLVVMAAVLCAFGTWVTAGLYFRTVRGSSAGLWLILAGVTGAATVFGTHFSAMLAYDPNTGVTLDPGMTALSLLAAAVGITASLHVSARVNPWLGGAMFGASVAAMHYTGMAAYSVNGVVNWDMGYVVASVVLAVVIGAMALPLAHRYDGWRGRAGSALVMLLAIVSLHFTGMAAMEVLPLAVDGGMSSAAATVLGVAIVGVGMVIIASALVANLIESRNAEAAIAGIKRMALHDTLTDLPNRAHFMQRLDDALVAVEGRHLAVLGIDLDHFKEINDLRGHAAGDAALQAVSVAMTAVLRRGEFLARLGGDEFAAYKEVATPEDAAEFATRLRAAVATPVLLPDGGEGVVDASIGVTMHPEDGATAATLLGNADLAMYRAKSTPGSYLCFYAQEMDEAVRSRRQVIGDLRLALAAGQFQVHYQPQTVVGSNDVVGYEALLRWNHPLRGNIPPSDFIPVAEETGLILSIGEWVLRTACGAAASWGDGRRVAVNLSAVQLSCPDLPSLVAAILSDTGLEPSRLELELTETAMMEHPERNMATLRKIQELGVAVAMDDFGTGHSSLSTLRHFPFDRIKLDRSFMSEIDASPQARAVIRAVLALGRSLEVPILAEGVETEAQLDFLQSEGCDEAQGYLLGRPAPLPHGPQAAPRPAPVAMAA